MKRRDTTSDGAHIRQAQRVACTTGSRTASRIMASEGEVHMSTGIANNLTLNGAGEPGGAFGVDLEPCFASRHDASSMWVDGRRLPNPWQARVGGAARMTCKRIAGQVPDCEPDVASVRTLPSYKRNAWTNVDGQRGQNTK